MISETRRRLDERAARIRERDALMWRLFMRGVSFEVLAKAFRVKLSTVENVAREKLSRPRRRR